MRLSAWLTLLISAACFISLPGCKKDGPTVVVYTSQDQVYSEPIFQDFTKQTGIKVLPVYDSEAVKTVGLVNRILAERAYPQCDVFWNNEEFRTRQLEKAGVLREKDPWVAFGFRARRLVINTNQLDNADCPRSLTAFTNGAAQGKIALAYPLFGTTATHFLLLREGWGEEAWNQWCQALVANKPLLVDGNSVVVKMVGFGEAWIGLTDSDDILAGQREGLPVAPVEIEAEGLYIRNTAAIIRNAPHPEAAQHFVDFLQSKEVLETLQVAGAIEGVTVPEGKGGIPGHWDQAVATQEKTMARLKEIFLR